MIELPRAALTARPDRRGRRLLLLRHQRPHPDRAGASPATTSRPRSSPRYLDKGVFTVSPFETIDATASAGWCGSPSRRAGPAEPEPQDRRLRRARRRPRVDPLLPRGRAGLRVLLPVPVPVARLEAGRRRHRLGRQRRRARRTALTTQRSHLCRSSRVRPNRTRARSRCSTTDHHQRRGKPMMSQVLHGIGVSPGAVAGPVVWLAPPPPDPPAGGTDREPGAGGRTGRCRARRRRQPPEGSWRRCGRYRGGRPRGRGDDGKDPELHEHGHRPVTGGRLGGLGRARRASRIRRDPARDRRLSRRAGRGSRGHPASRDRPAHGYADARRTRPRRSVRACRARPRTCRHCRAGSGAGPGLRQRTRRPDEPHRDPGQAARHPGRGRLPRGRGPGQRSAGGRRRVRWRGSRRPAGERPAGCRGPSSGARRSRRTDRSRSNRRRRARHAAGQRRDGRRRAQGRGRGLGGRGPVPHRGALPQPEHRTAGGGAGRRLRTVFDVFAAGRSSFAPSMPGRTSRFPSSATGTRRIPHWASVVCASRGISQSSCRTSSPPSLKRRRTVPRTCGSWLRWCPRRSRPLSSSSRREVSACRRWARWLRCQPLRFAPTGCSSRATSSASAQTTLPSTRWRRTAWRPRSPTFSTSGSRPCSTSSLRWPRAARRPVGPSGSAGRRRATRCSPSSSSDWV